MKPWVKITAIFIAGILLGAAATGLTIHHCFRHFGGPPPNADAILKMLSSRLNLTAEQKDKVALLIKEQVPKMEALRQKTQASFKAQRDAFHAKLKPLLDPQQQVKLEAMAAKWDHRDNGKNCRLFHCAGKDPTPAVSGK
jgi:hypothetical protein